MLDKKSLLRESYEVPHQTVTPRIAVLVLAHTHPTLLDRLATRLSEDFDVYIHLDRTSKIDLTSFEWRDKVSEVPSRRTYWGSFQCTRAVLDLLSAARQKGYDRYVLISGQHVPLVSNSEISSFFSQNPDLDFIESLPLPSPVLQGGIERISRVYWQAPYRHQGARRWLYNVVEYALELGYRTLLQPKLITGQFYWGQTWFSLKASTVDAIFAYLEKHPDFIRLFTGSRLGEELFLQTLVHRIEPAPQFGPTTTTYDDWITGPEKPRVLDHTDYPTLRGLTQLFARKVDPKKSKKLIDRLYAETEPKPRD